MPKISKESNFFKTSDLSLIAALQLYGYQIESMDRSNTGKVIFLIKRDAKIDKLVKSFWNKELRTCPLSYFESLKSIKTRIHQ